VTEVYVFKVFFVFDDRSLGSLSDRSLGSLSDRSLGSLSDRSLNSLSDRSLSFQELAVVIFGEDTGSWCDILVDYEFFERSNDFIETSKF